MVGAQAIPYIHQRAGRGIGHPVESLLCLVFCSKGAGMESELSINISVSYSNSVRLRLVYPQPAGIAKAASSKAPPPLWATATDSGRCPSTLVMPRVI